MKDKAVAVINADKLLEWLERFKDEAEYDRDKSETESKKFYMGYVSAIREIIRHVEYEKYLVDKPADNEEEE